MKITGLLALAVFAFSTAVAGCSGHEVNMETVTMVAQSPTSTANTSVPPPTSTATVATSAPPPTSTSGTTTAYGGLVQPPLASAPPNQIWVDPNGVYPNVLTVKAGTTVTWADAIGGPTFTVVSNGSLFQGSITGLGTPGEQTFSYLFANPGIFGYSIDPINATDSGEIIVTG